MNKTIVAIGVVVFVWFGYFTYIRNSGLSKKQPAESADMRERTRKTKALALANKYSAVVDWAAALDKESTIWDGVGIESYHSLRIENAVRKHEPRPVLMIADIQDVKRQGDKYWISCNNGYPYNSQYLLEVTAAQANDFAALPKNFNSYGIIARIESVVTPDIRLDGVNNSDDGYGTEIEFDSSGSYYIFRGKVVDTVCLDCGDVKEKA